LRPLNTKIKKATSEKIHQEPAPGKNKAFIYDFVDVENPVFKASAKSRYYTYKNQNIGT